MKGDHSKKVGGRRNAKAVDKAPRTRTPRGKAVRYTRGQSGYHRR